MSILVQNTEYNLKSSFIHRRPNIHPYDFNRVRLKTPINGEDYINASVITGPGANLEGEYFPSSETPPDDNVKDYVKDPDDPSRWSNINFIACQGPLPETTVHHLQMIFENKIDIVVMLTACQEKEQRTC